MSVPHVISTSADWAAIVDKYDTFLCDCDGVLWRGSEVLDGVKESLEYLESIGKKVIFVTNNGTKSREQYLSLFTSRNLNATKSSVFSSSYAAASYLTSLGFADPTKKVYVVGEAGVTKELEEAGIAWAGSYTDNEPCSASECVNLPLEENVGAVLVSFDSAINYKKVSKAMQHLKNKDCLLVATNADATFPAAGGVHLPGGGTIVAMVETCSMRKATVVGKPQSLFLDLIFSSHPTLDRSRTVMIGDRLDTDIRFGAAGQLATIMVLTGVNSHEQALEADVKPTYILPSFGNIVSLKQQ